MSILTAADYPSFLNRFGFRCPVAEQRGRFSVDDVSPVRAAVQISAPVLLIHGANDVDTPPAHSQRVYEALRGPKRLIMVPAAGHNQSLHSELVWSEIDRWTADILNHQI